MMYSRDLQQHFSNLVGGAANREDCGDNCRHVIALSQHPLADNLHRKSCTKQTDSTQFRAQQLCNTRAADVVQKVRSGGSACLVMLHRT